MANHLGAAPKKKKRKKSASLSWELPRLFVWKAPQRRIFRYKRVFSKAELVPVAAAFVLFIAALAVPMNDLLKLVAFAVTAFVAGFSILRRAADDVFHRHWPDEDCFALLAALCAFFAAQPALGAVLVILARLQEFMESYILARSARGIELIREHLPEKAHVEEDYGLVDVLPEEVRAGDVFVVRPGETVPVDGVVLEGQSRVDSTAFGGRAQLDSSSAGDEILAGGVIVDSELKLRALHSFADSALARHLNSLEDAENEKTAYEDRLEYFASFYSPCMLCLAVVMGVLLSLIRSDWRSGLGTAAIVLLLASPSALVLSVPVIYLGGLFCASHGGIRFRAKQVMEKLFRARTAVFSKTGTITEGCFVVTDVAAFRVSEEKLLRIAAAAESCSRHPVAAAIKQAANWQGAINTSDLDAAEIPGQGVTALIDGKRVLVGNAALMEKNGVWFQIPDQAGTAIHVAADNTYLGYILMNDKPRENAFDSIEELRSLGLKDIVLLTGDVQSSTSQLARSLNFSMVKTALQPDEKVSAVSFLRKSLGKGETLFCVGDGFHDAELFASADVGIALSAMGDDRAENAADVILMDDDIQRIPAVMRIARGVSRLLMENVLLLCGSRMLLLFLALIGLLSPLPTALLNCLAVCLACINALRSYSVE